MTDKRDISSMIPGVAHAAVAEIYRVQGWDPTRFSEECARAAGGFLLGEALLDRLRKRYPDFVGDWRSNGVFRDDVTALARKLGGPEQYVLEYPLIHLAHCDVTRMARAIAALTDEVLAKFYEYDADGRRGGYIGEPEDCPDRDDLYALITSVADDRVTLAALKPGGALDFSPYRITVGAEKHIIGGTYLAQLALTDCAITDDGVTIMGPDLSLRPQAGKHVEISNGLEMHGLTLTRQVPEGVTLADGLRAKIDIAAEGTAYLTAADLSHPWKLALATEAKEAAPTA